MYLAATDAVDGETYRNIGTHLEIKHNIAIKCIRCNKMGTF